MLLFLVICRWSGNILMGRPMTRSAGLLHDLTSWLLSMTHKWENMGHQPKLPVFAELGFERRVSRLLFEEPLRTPQKLDLMMSQAQCSE